MLELRVLSSYIYTSKVNSLLNLDNFALAPKRKLLQHVPLTIPNKIVTGLKLNQNNIHK
jgi:hypothetical protein